MKILPAAFTTDAERLARFRTRGLPAQCSRRLVDAGMTSERQGHHRFQHVSKIATLVLVQETEPGSRSSVPIPVFTCELLLAGPGETVILRRRLLSDTPGTSGFSVSPGAGLGMWLTSVDSHLPCRRERTRHEPSAGGFTLNNQRDDPVVARICDVQPTLA